MKHIEGYLSRPEIAADKKMGGQLTALYEQREKEDHIEIDTRDQFPFPSLQIILFHKDDLPFSYSSVVTYIQRIVDIAARDKRLTKVATTVHGPGAGLDASEAMETMLVAIANKLRADDWPTNLEEVIFVEKQKEIFDRLQQRLIYLSKEKGLILIKGDEMLVNSATVPSSDHLSLKPFFIAMPYKEDFDNVYYYGIKKPIEDIGRQCERVDQEKFVGDIVERIKTRIKESELIIADITGNNPNVFYEVGYAQGIGKKVVLISQEKEAPFDLRTQRQIIYQPHKIFALETQLKELLVGIV